MATLRHIGGNLYFYVDDGYWNGLSSSRQDVLRSNMANLANEFDSNIYPKETQFWGSEPNPGVDNDPRITLLLEELDDNNGGYVETGNGYSSDKIAESNQREMISLNVGVVMSEPGIAKMFLGHEFQHLISFNQKEKLRNLSEDVWLNEMRSEYSISVIGYNDNYSGSSLEKRVRTFLNSSDDSLTEWPNSNADYSTAALFSEYLAEQFGREILSETMKLPAIGIDSLNRYLESRKYPERFGDAFMNWLGALYLNDTNQNSKLGYQRPELKALKVSPQERVFLSQGLAAYSSVRYLKDWQPVWLVYELGDLSNNPDNSIKIELAGDSGQNFLSSYLAFYNDGSVEYGKINVKSGLGTGYAVNSAKKLQKVAVMATKATKTFGFGTSEPASNLNVKVSLIDSGDVQSLVLKDGALIKRPNEREVYVIWGKYKRYLNPEVISLYGHLNPSNAIELQPEIFDSYTSSNYVKYINDEKVYAVWPDGTKHWLHITPKQWDDSYRDWNAIFTINELEVNHYRLGADITR